MNQRYAGQAPSASNREATKDLATVLVKIAQCHGAAAFLPDAFLLELVTRSQLKSFWQLAGQHLFAVGLIDCEPGVKTLCRASGVVVWIGARERRVMIVNAKRLTEPFKIHNFVTAQPELGRRCRFCGLEEDDTGQLIQVGTDRAPGYTADDQVILQMRRVMVHPDLIDCNGQRTEARCESHWQTWISIAEKYANEFREGERAKAVIPSSRPGGKEKRA